MEIDTDTEATRPAEEEPSRSRWLRTDAWILVPVGFVLVAMSHALTNSRVFFIRDMSFLFWPVHRWYRNTVWSGDSPMWDPYIGFGQPAVGDAVRQMFFPPVVLLRLLLPEALGFNLSVVLAMVLAAAGAYVLARRRQSPTTAAFAGTVFALSGPVMSGGNVLNTLWSISLIPWTVWAADRVAERTTIRRCAALAALFALQVLAGEPVTLASGAVLTFGFVLFGTRMTGWRERAAVFGSVMLSGVFGLAVAAVQVIPLADAVRRSSRGIEGVPDILAAHPLAILEGVVGPLFGNPNAPWTQPQPWLTAMNDGNDPYVFSLYVGVPVIVLAVLGAQRGSDRNWRVFWTTASVLGVVCSMGRFTVVYPLLQKLVPVLESFRYPSKYTGVVALAIALLAAAGWEALAGLRAEDRAWKVTGGVAIAFAFASAAVWAVCVVAAASVEVWVQSLAAWMHVASPDTAAAPVVAALLTRMRELFLVATATCGALAASIELGPSAAERLHPAKLVLAGLAIVPLLAHNGSLNPMLDVDLLRSPSWIDATREHADERFFAPGRIAHSVGRAFEPGIPRRADPPSEMSRLAAEAVLNEQFAVFPGVSRAREGISVDVTQLWPREYARAIRTFAWNSPARRALFLERTGTRYVVDRDPPVRDAVEIQPFDDYDVSLYEVPPPLPRVFVVARSTLVPNSDVQTERLFDPGFDPRLAVMLERDAPAPSGSASAPATEIGASIVQESTTSLEVRASVQAPDGFLVVHDSWDPYWTATVDGAPAQVVRANALFRAVHLAAGEHVVRFTFEPTPFRVGLGVSLCACLLLIVSGASRLGGVRLYTRPHGKEAV